MPPSGYSKEQSELIQKFLISVSNDLKQEGQILRLSPEKALKREIENIDQILNSENYKLYESVLTLTRWFYAELLVHKPIDYINFIDVRKEVLTNVQEVVLSIHVDPLIDK